MLGRQLLAFEVAAIDPELDPWLEPERSIETTRWRTDLLDCGASTGKGPERAPRSGEGCPPALYDSLRPRPAELARFPPLPPRSYQASFDDMSFEAQSL